MTIEDVKLLVDSFYEKVLVDDRIGHFFTQVMNLNFDEHMPKMHAFWEAILLDKMGYAGNPMMQHVQLHKKAKIEEKHLDRWLHLWVETTDELFEGELANKAKEKAHQIGGLILHKISLL